MALTRRDLAAALPVLDGSISVHGLTSGVEICRDPEGVPHLNAATLADAFFAQGFVHAQDRLWQMEYDRRRAYGRWAEYAGPSALAQDIHYRHLGLGASARVDYETVDAGAGSMLDAYAAGVNAFLVTTPALPIEFQLLDARPEPWTPADSVAVFKVRHVEMGPWQAKIWRARLVGHLGPELAAKLCPGTQPNPTLIVPPGLEYDGPAPDGLGIFTTLAPALAEAGCWSSGSNNWAVSGGRTASGRPLVAGDPHRPLDVPNVYYQNHLTCPEFDAIGFSFPGVPGLPHFGHNRFLAWCVTHAMADAQDLFVERFDVDDPGRYLFKGEWRRATISHETIRVREAAPVTFDVTVTHHGPIALGDPRSGHGIAFRYSATAQPNRTFEAFLPMLRATSADELETAMRPWIDPVNNLVFADVHGTIGYRTRGQVPVRAAANAWVPVPGWDGAHEWMGVIPFEEMPAQRNPGSGWIATANSRIAGPDYRHYIGLDFAPDFRTRRVVSRLGALQRATAADMAAIHADHLSIPAGELLDLLDAVVPTGRLARQALERLRAWDGAMAREAVAPAIYAVFRERLMRDFFSPLLGGLAPDAFGTLPGGPVTHMARLHALLAAWMRADDRALLPRGIGWPAALSQAFDAAVEELRASLGSDIEQWHWAKLHVTNPRHPLSAVFSEAAPLLDPPSVAVSGDGDTVQAGTFVPAAGFAVTSTSVARYVFDLNDWDNSAWIVPLGASGHPGSGHYADQAQDWADVRLRPMRYAWDRIRAEADSRQQLDPVKETQPKVSREA